jgi:hypothetical protein
MPTFSNGKLPPDSIETLLMMQWLSSYAMNFTLSVPARQISTTILSMCVLLEPLAGGGLGSLVAQLAILQIKCLIAP